MMGSAFLLIMDLFMAIPADIARTSLIIFIVALLVDVFVTLIGEFSVPHASEVAATAAHEITHGRYRNHFWWGSVTLGHAVPLALGLLMFFITSPFIGAIAGLSAAIGLYLFEYAFVMAPQEVPNS